MVMLRLMKAETVRKNHIDYCEFWFCCLVKILRFIWCLVVFLHTFCGTMDCFCCSVSFFWWFSCTLPNVLVSDLFWLGSSRFSFCHCVNDVCACFWIKLYLFYLKNLRFLLALFCRLGLDLSCVVHWRMQQLMMCMFGFCQIIIC